MLVFDLLANLVELDRADRRGRHAEVSPNFAMFGVEPQRPVVARMLQDERVRDGLLPGRSQHDTARLLLSLDAHAKALANACASFWHGIADGATAERLRTIVGTS